MGDQAGRCVADSLLLSAFLTAHAVALALPIHFICHPLETFVGVEWDMEVLILTYLWYQFGGPDQKLRTQHQIQSSWHVHTKHT